VKQFRSAVIAGAILVVVSVAVMITVREAGASPNPASVHLSGGSNQTLHFMAGTGTVNTVTVKPRPSGGFILEDSTGTIELASGSGPTCVAGGAHVVRCSADVTKLDIRLADGDDYYNNGTSVPSYVEASHGDDELLGGTGPDTFNGGPHKDKLYGGYGNDVLEGGSGVDTVYGQVGNDALTSKADSRDHLWGGPGKDTLDGSADSHGDDDNDTFIMRLAGDYWGGTGTDLADFSEWTETAHVSLDGNQNDGNAGADPTDDCGSWIGGCVPEPMNVHSDIENIKGTKFNDLIIGSDADNALDGGAGNDALDGRGATTISMSSSATNSASAVAAAPTTPVWVTTSSSRKVASTEPARARAARRGQLGRGSIASRTTVPRGARR
jgi:Ca2+-binding RTX toxin-like protein